MHCSAQGLVLGDILLALDSGNLVVLTLLELLAAFVQRGFRSVTIRLLEQVGLCFCFSLELQQ